MCIFVLGGVLLAECDDFYQRNQSYQRYCTLGVGFAEERAALKHRAPPKGWHGGGMRAPLGQTHKTRGRDEGVLEAPLTSQKADARQTTVGRGAEAPHNAEKADVWRGGGGLLTRRGGIHPMTSATVAEGQTTAA